MKIRKKRHFRAKISTSFLTNVAHFYGVLPLNLVVFFKNLYQCIQLGKRHVRVKFELNWRILQRLITVQPFRTGFRRRGKNRALLGNFVASYIKKRTKYRKIKTTVKLEIS